MQRERASRGEERRASVWNHENLGETREQQEETVEEKRSKASSSSMLLIPTVTSFKFKLPLHL